MILAIVIGYQLFSTIVKSRKEKQRQDEIEKQLQDERSHEHSQTADFHTIEVFPSRSFFGTDVIISGQLAKPPAGGTNGMPFDVVAEFKAVWIGIDGEADIYKLCDIYSDGELPKPHGQFPVNLPIRRKDVRQEKGNWNFSIRSGHEIARYGGFQLCVYDPAEAGPGGKLGRYVYTGSKLGIDDVHRYGLYMITQLKPDLAGDERSDTLQVLRQKLNNPAIAEIHFLQQDEDITVFPDDVIRHPKFRFTVVGSPLTYAHVVEYGSRFLTDYRILYAPLEVAMDESLFHFTEISPSAFYSHLYAISAQIPSDDSITTPALSTFVFIPSQLGQLHPKEMEVLGDKADEHRRESSKLSKSVSAMEASPRINGPHFVERVRDWYPKVLVVDPSRLIYVTDPIPGRGRAQSIYSGAIELTHPDWKDPSLIEKKRSWFL